MNKKEIKISILGKFYHYIRFLFVHSKFELFFNEHIANLALRFACRSKFLRWLKIHPCKEFNDRHWSDPYALYTFLLETENLKGQIDFLEFGVAKGQSIKWWIERNKDAESRFIGFDTFLGLPEDYGRVPKGAFSADGKPPEIEDARCSFEIGLFQDTLFGFLERFRLNRKTVVHIDCDLYGSTLFVLTALVPKLKKGDILIFDEFGSIRHPAHEFRAFYDFQSAYKVNYRVIGASNFYHQVAIKLI